MEQIQDYCNELSISNIAMLKENKTVLFRRLLEEK